MQVKQKRGRFIVDSKDKSYVVDLARETCSCPHFSFRLKGKGEKCKHIMAAEDFVAMRRANMQAQLQNRYEDILLFIRNSGEVDSAALIQKFGEQDINFMLFRGDIIEVKGKVRAS